MDRFMSIITVIVLSVIVGLGIWFFNFKDSGVDSIIYKDLVVNDLVSDISFDDKPNIYLFWGDGCSHCESLKTFINDLPLEYKELFILNVFEVWYNDDNEEFMLELSNHFDEEIDSVPYLVIGDETFSGYAPIFDEDIKEAIMLLSDSKYDAYKEIKQ